MADIRVILQATESFEATVTDPLFTGEVYDELEQDQVFYRRKCPELTFLHDDFCLIAGAQDCEKIKVTIDVKCGDEWRTEFKGSFNHYNCYFNWTDQELRVTPDPEDLYKCLFDTWDTEQNIYHCGPEVAARGVIGTYEAGLFPCFTCRATPDESPCNDHTAEACLEYSKVVAYPSPKCPEPTRFEINTVWHREIGVGTPTTPPGYGSGWAYISSGNWWRCPDSERIKLGVFRRGRTLQAMLQYIMGLLGCNITVRSHFFNINATHPSAPVNIAYNFAEEYLRNITVHQKSDVKRQDASNPSLSKVWVMKPKDLLDDFRKVFNLYFVIKGTEEAREMWIEHISYFESTVGLDVSAQEIPIEYRQDDENSPEKETFKWSDNVTLSNAHAGYPITYECGGPPKEVPVTLFTNDLPNIVASVNAENISDKNFVLIANQIYSGQRLIFENNAPMGWEMLHDKLHRHNRYFIEGTMNNSNTTFLSARPTRKLTPFDVIPFCCDEEWDASKLVNTPIGPGKVRRAARNLVADTLNLELLI